MKKIGAILAASAAFFLSPIGLVQAQDDDLSAGITDQNIETIYITGSFIPRQTGNMSSPVALIGQDDFRAQGAFTISDVINNLTINTGSQNQTDAFTQNVSTGTTNINLRGLGVSSTLVLLNGHRQVVSGAPTDLGLLFVDTSSLVPLIAVQRLEILKDGAAALYGSDAVAGVANFITRDNFEGVELSAGIKSVTGASQNDITAEGLFGWGNDRTHILAAFEYLHRSSLSTAERRFPGSRDPVNGDFSNAGFPGSFIVPYTPSGPLAPLAPFWTAAFDSAGVIPGVADFFEQLLLGPGGIVPGAKVPVVTDPSCAAGANSVVPATFPFGFCRLDFGDFFDLVAQERRIQAYLSFRHDFSDDVTFRVELSGARNRADRNNSPSFPIPGPQLFLPNVPGLAVAYNPFNPFGLSPVLAGPTTLPLLFIGRPVGEGDPAPSQHDSDTYRVHTGFNGAFGESGTWDISFTHAANDFFVGTQDTIASRFSLALNGLGGAGCNPMTGTPGVGGCQFFNPFGTSLTAAPGATVPNSPAFGGGPVPLANDQTLIDWFTGPFTQDYYSSLTVVDGVITNQFTGNLPFPIGAALGFQYRRENYSLNYDPISNTDGFLFVLGGQDFQATQTVFAVFGELILPVHDRVEIQVALRYENYNTMAGDTLDPKVGIFIEATDSLIVRGSWGTSFRGPNIFQQFGTQTSVQQLTDALPGQPTTPSFFAVRSTGNTMLVPESAKNINVGFMWEPSDRFTFTFDFWRFNFTNIIVQESAQAIIDASMGLDPRIERSPFTGSITLINNTWTNASSLKTSGIDIHAEYLIPLTDRINFTVGGDATYILNYDLVDPQAGFVSGEGRRNFANFGVSTPELRFTLFGNARSGSHDAYIFVRYIDSYTDDQNALPVSSHTTVDLQYNYVLGDPDDQSATRFSIGVINVFDNLPPTLLTNLGFDTKVHNPLGRMVYGKITQGF